MKNAVRFYCFQIAAAVLMPAGAFAAQQPAQAPGPDHVTQEELPQLRRAASECKKDTPDSWNLAGTKDSRLQKIKLELMLYSVPGAMLQACVALEHPDNCKSLRLLPADVDVCRRFGNQVTLIKSIFKGDPQAACRHYLDRDPGTSKKLTEDDRNRICKRAVATMKDPAGYDNFCERMLSRDGEPVTKESLKNCTDRTVFMKAEPKLCDALPTPVDWYGYCEVSAALVAATRLGRPEACSNMPLCRTALSGEAPDCESYRVAFDKAYCDGVAKALTDLGALKPEAAKPLDAAAERRLQREIEANKRADAEVARQVAAKEAAQRKKDKRQFKKGTPMTDSTQSIEQTMHRLEKGLPAEPPAKPKTTTDTDAQPSSGANDDKSQ